MNNDAREDRIRRRAYQLWLEDGRPDGRAEEHWQRAAALEGQSQVAEDALGPNPSGRMERPAAGRGAVEPPEAIDNQGDFPGLADQGEESPRVPRLPRRSRRKP